MKLPDTFPIEQYSYADKTEISQELADWLVENNYIKPVYKDEKGSIRDLYLYDSKKCIWKEVDKKRVLNIVKDYTGREYTRHLKQEFLNQLENHPESLDFENLGLPEHQILLKNGKILDLETRETIRVTKHDHALNMINAEIDGEKETEKFLKFLKETIPDQTQRKTIQEFLGYCLKFPNANHEKALIILGDTDTGKSTLLKIFRELFKYCEMSEVSLAQLGHERRFHVEEAAESIINIDEDMSGGEIKDLSAIKQIISNEKMFVERKGQQGFDLIPRTKLMMASNVSPNTQIEDDPAFYNRFLTIEAPNRVPKEEQDKQLVDTLTSQKYLNGILHWALNGLERLEEQGTFSQKLGISETKDLWDQFGNDVQKFIAECIEFEKGEHEPTTDVYEKYELWSVDSLNDTLPRNEFISKMSSHPKISKERIDLDLHGQKTCFTNCKVKI